jgi:hypothetical protein
LWHYNICTNANGARGFGSREACITESKAKGEPLERNWEKLGEIEMAESRPTSELADKEKERQLQQQLDELREHYEGKWRMAVLKRQIRIHMVRVQRRLGLRYNKQSQL